MRTAAVPPYLLPPDDAVSTEPWRTEDGVELGDRLDHWDPFTDLQLVRALTVDTDAIRAACQLGPDSALAAVATWRSDRTRLAGHSDTVEFGALDGTLRVPLELRVPGASTGGRLDLQVSVVLRTPGSSPSSISPRRNGAILWNDRTRLALEGAAARFPVTATDFSADPGLPDGGSWKLEWSSDDLDTPVLGAVRLLVNTANQELLETIRSGSADARSKVVRSFVTFDVARAFVHGALRNEEFVGDPESFDEGTVGRMLVELLTACWPGVPIPTLRLRALDDPARLEAQLQAHFGLFR